MGLYCHILQIIFGLQWDFICTVFALRIPLLVCLNRMNRWMVHAARSKEPHRIFYLENTKQHLGSDGAIRLKFVWVVIRLDWRRLHACRSYVNTVVKCRILQWQRMSCPAEKNLSAQEIPSFLSVLQFVVIIYSDVARLCGIRSEWSQWPLPNRNYGLQSIAVHILNLLLFGSTV